MKLTTYLKRWHLMEESGRAQIPYMAWYFIASIFRCSQLNTNTSHTTILFLKIILPLGSKCLFLFFCPIKIRIALFDLGMFISLGRFYGTDALPSESWIKKLRLIPRFSGKNLLGKGLAFLIKYGNKLLSLMLFSHIRKVIFGPHL